MTKSLWQSRAKYLLPGCSSEAGLGLMIARRVEAFSGFAPDFARRFCCRRRDNRRIVRFKVSQSLDGIE